MSRYLKDWSFAQGKFMELERGDAGINFKALRDALSTALMQISIDRDFR